MIDTYWIDVCPNDENLLATGGGDSKIKIYDQRIGKVACTLGVGQTSNHFFLVSKCGSIEAIIYINVLRLYLLCQMGSLR